MLLYRVFAGLFAPTACTFKYACFLPRVSTKLGTVCGWKSNVVKRKPAVTGTDTGSTLFCLTRKCNSPVTAAQNVISRARDCLWRTIALSRYSRPRIAFGIATKRKGNTMPLKLEEQNRRVRRLWATALVIPALLILMGQAAPVAMGQSNSTDQGRTPSKDEVSKLQASMPSKEELSELLTKADEKISSFEQVVKNAKPYLDKIDAKYAANYLDAALTAHYLIQTTIKDGASAYRLVGVLATMDDLSLDAANGSLFLLGADNEQGTQGKPPDLSELSAVIALTAAGTSCNDIADLLLHATLRLVNTEEKLLEVLLPKNIS
jgi:hypothetical protein